MKIINLTKSNFINRFLSDFETCCSFIILVIGCVISYNIFSHELLLYILIFIPVFIGAYLILILNHKIYVYAIDFQSEIYSIIYCGLIAITINSSYIRFGVILKMKFKFGLAFMCFLAVTQ